MVDVVVSRIVFGNVLQRIPGECVAAVIVNGLDGRASEEPHSLSRRHARDHKRETRAQRVQQESFEWVVVQSAESVRNVQTVMA